MTETAKLRVIVAAALCVAVSLRATAQKTHDFAPPEVRAAVVMPGRPDTLSAPADAALVVGTAPVTDSAAISKLDAMLSGYVAAIEPLDPKDKSAECDFIISTCTDESLRTHTTAWLFEHYMDSSLMGDEAVAVDIYDRWVAAGKVTLPEDIRRLAEVFVMFNRESLIGNPAPVLTLETMQGENVEVPSRGGRQSVLYFYDTHCAKCKMESILLNAWMQEARTPITVYAIYTGVDREAWLGYVSERFTSSGGAVELVHCWDPGRESDFVLHYGVTATPRMLLVDEQGIIRGRRLTVESLGQVLAIGEMRRELLDRTPVGSVIPDITLRGTLLRTGSRSEGIYNLRHIGGKRNYIVFYTAGCANCKSQLAAVEAALGRRDRALLIDVDNIIAQDSALAEELFDTFDLSVMPYIMLTGRRGRILEKYLSL